MKKRRTKVLLLAIAIVLIAIVGTYFFIRYRTYDYIQVIETHENDNTDNAQYKYCMGGILRYSRDGVALLSAEGKEEWNQPIQMSTPVVEMCGNSFAVGDKGGTSIFVFQKKGLKGEIQTTRPIEKFAVSSQGVVSAILKDEETPLVMCYDAKGNVLVEHKASIKNMGYPLEVALSEDGNALLVSYLSTQGNGILTKVAYYYFGNNAETDNNHQVLEEEFADAIIPSMAFLNEEVSLLVADERLLFYEGVKKPKQVAQVELKEQIQSIAYSKDTVAVLLKSSKGSGCKFQTYDIKGKLLASVDLEKEYTNIKVDGDRVIMYNGQLCGIYIRNGIRKYEGKMDDKIVEIFSVAGLNKYMVINANGFQKVKLAK